MFRKLVWGGWVEVSVLAAAASVAVVLCSGSVRAAVAAPEAEDRGRISLAWDAHESGLCGEVLRYVDEIKARSASAPEGLWLKADCLRSMERFGQALSLLESPTGRMARDWEGLVRSVVEDWVWSATGTGDYEVALSAVGRGLSILPGELSLQALMGATSFRQEVYKRLAHGGREEAILRLSTGEELFVRKGRASPGGRKWLRVYPWEAESPWIPEVTLEDWMPSLAGRLGREHKTLWMRIPRGAMDRLLKSTAGAQGLAVRAQGREARLVEGREGAYCDREEWVFRAAVEGLGLKGAASEAVSGAVSTLKARRALFEWVSRNRGPLQVSRDGTVLRLWHPSTSRSYELDADSWASAYDPESKDWKEFWSDLSAELGRLPTAYRCFCGRGALLRETLTQDPGAALTVEKGRGYFVILTALCPFHQQFVTPDLLKEWGVTLSQARERAKKDAEEKAWDLSFERGEEGGTRYLALRGEGASSLVRSPALLLGALEAVEGREVRGTSVQVLATTSSSVVVVGGGVPMRKARAAAARSLLRGARRGEITDRLGYRAALRLPPSSQGVFEVREAEDP